MPPIQVEQFVLPHGRKENITVDLDPEYWLKAERIQKEGFVFQVETLTTGERSWTIFNSEIEEDVAYHIVDPVNTSDTEAVTKLIREFDI